MTAPPPVGVRFKPEGEGLVESAIKDVTTALAGLSRQAKKTGSDVKQGSDAAEVSARNFSNLARNIQQFGAALGVARIAAFVKDAVAAADAIGKLSQATGIGSETTSVFAYAAKQADVELGALRTGMRGLARSLVELENGNDKTTAAFAALGLSAADFVGLSLDQAFLKVANAQRQYADGTGKAVAAGTIFGDRIGTQLIPLLNDLSGNGFQRAAQEAQNLGVVFSEEAVQKADEFGDALDRLGAAAQGAGVQFGTGLLPSITQSIDLLTQGASDTGSAINILGQGVGFVIRFIVSTLDLAAATLAAFASATVATFTFVKDVMAAPFTDGTVKQAAQTFFNDLGAIKDQVLEDDERRADFLYGSQDQREQEQFARTLRRIREEREERNRTQVQITEDEAREQERRRQQAERDAQKRQQANERYDEYEARRQEETRRELERAQDAERHKAKERERAEAAEREQDLAKAKAAAERVESGTTNAKDALVSAGGTATDALSDGLTDVLNKTADLGDIWKGTAVSVTQSINRIISRLLIQLAVQQLVNAASGFLGIGGGEAKAATSVVKKLADGGFVSGPGGPTADRVPAMLSNGEYVVRAAAVRALGVGFLNSLNGMRAAPRAVGGLPRFADGGAVVSDRAVSLSAEIGLSDGLVAQSIASKGADAEILAWATRNRKALRALTR